MKDKPHQRQPQPVTPVQEGRFRVVWVDTQPHAPLFNDGVMRWDLRQDDWWKNWPEMIVHPCAYQWAKTHPTRVGPPRVEDWVATFPEGFDWRTKLHADWHPQIEAVLAHWDKSPESQLPTEPALIPNGVLYTVDASGRPRRFGTIAGENAIDLDERAKLRRMAREAGECVEDLARMLSHVDEGARLRLAELLATLVRAPDSERTKAAIRELLTPVPAAAPAASAT